MSEQETVLLHWIEEYDGVHVVAQLKSVYFSVRSPGVCIPLMADGQPMDMENPKPIAGFHKMPFVQGTARIKSDEQGNYRMVIRTPDPTGSGDFVHVDLDPEMIDSVSVIEEKSVIERAAG